VSQNADECLENFCSYQNKINTKSENMFHHDVGILITR
jgi:hypothetical protein